MNIDKALSIGIKRGDVQKIIDRVEDNGITIDKIVNDIVSEYCKPLDDYMRVIDSMLIEGNEISDYELDDFALNLPCLIYFACTAQETLGVKEDISKAVRSEVFNLARDKAEGTVSDKDTIADLSSQKETIVVIVYQRAYKKVKQRIEAAYEMLNSVKKVMSRRMVYQEVSNKDLQ